MLHVNLIGVGRVGQALLRLTAAAPGFEIGQVASRNLATAEAAVESVGQGKVVDRLEDFMPADIWCLAVPDDAIADVAQQLAASGVTPSLAIHFSGYHAASVMDALDGWQLASAHPNLSFADPATTASRFAGSLVAIEGESEATDRARALMTAFGATCFGITAAQKPLYHSAAVIANNYPVVLQACAREIWHSAGVPDDIACELGLSLLRAAVANLEAGAPDKVLTGPAARGDSDVVRVETKALSRWRDDAGDLYGLMAEMAQRLKAEGNTGGQGGRNVS